MCRVLRCDRRCTACMRAHRWRKRSSKRSAVSYGRRDARLASMGSNREAFSRPIRNEAIVAMGDEEVFVRMDRIARNMTPGRQRDKNRDRQHVRFGHDNGRVQHQEVSRRWRQEVDWKRRGRDEAEVRKHDDRPLDVGEFLRRRRRHVIIDKGKRRRRLERDGKQGQPPPGVPSMRSTRVPAQIRPVRLRRVDQAGALPRERFPAHRDDRAHPLCQRIASVHRQKFLVAV